MLIGMAVGVDYSLFYLKREREERRAGRGHIDAIEVAAATSGHSVLFSAFAVLVSMGSLFLVGDAVFSSLAAGGIIVVAVAMLGSLTVLPALLAKLGSRVDRPRVPLLWRLTNRDGEPRLWLWLLSPALAHPKRTLAITVAILAVIAAPAFGLTLRSSGLQTLPRSVPAVAVTDRIVHAFPDQNASLDVVVSAPAAQSTTVEHALDRLRATVARQPLFGAQAGQVRASADRRTHAVAVDIQHPDGTPAARHALAELRRTILPHQLSGIGSVRYGVTGSVADSVDYSAHQSKKLPYVVGFVLLLTFVLMSVTFRSVVIGLTAIAVNLLSAGVAFGVLALVFQHSWAQGILRFHSNGAVVSWIPLFLFAVLFGLSMDYHVFVVSRIAEAVRRGMSTRDAVHDDISRSAGVVTSAAVVMMSVFAVFATLHMVEMKQMGVGLTVAVAIDALVIRTLVLPSVMILLGRANWWPSQVSRHGPDPIAFGDAPVRELTPTG